MNSRPRSAVVLVFDRLNAGFLGPYGNTWVDTPGCNRLASEGLLWEHALVDSPHLEGVYRSYWSGSHAAQSTIPADRTTLAELLHQAGLRAELLTDEPLVAQLPDAEHFADRLLLEHEPAAGAAEDMDGTQIGRFLASAFDHWQAERPEALLWCHCRAMAGDWDAPWELRERLADEDDPPPPRWLTPPDRQLDRGYDPDELLGVIQAYAGQILAWDACLDAWLDAFHDLAAQRETLLIVTGSRGFPLGEHLRIGPCDHALYGELLNVPLVIRLPNCEGQLIRDQALVQPADLFSTLADWFELQTPATIWGQSLLPTAGGIDSRRRDVACALSATERAIRTPAWFLRESPTARELYVKPDDRWEANEVGDRCLEAVEQLHQLLDIAAATPRDSLPPLSDLLQSGVD